MQTLTSTNFAIPFSRQNNTLVLVANVAQSFTVPADCYRVHFNMDPLGQTFWVNDQATAVIPLTSKVDGLAPECNPEMRLVQPGQPLSCISAYAGNLTISCYNTN